MRTVLATRVARESKDDHSHLYKQKDHHEYNTLRAVSASTLADTILPIGLTDADTDPAIRDPRAVSSVDRSAVDTIIAEWPARPRLGANVMIAQYGAPQEVTSEKLGVAGNVAVWFLAERTMMASVTR